MFVQDHLVIVVLRARALANCTPYQIVLQGHFYQLCVMRVEFIRFFLKKRYALRLTLAILIAKNLTFSTKNE